MFMKQVFSLNMSALYSDIWTQKKFDLLPSFFSEDVIINHNSRPQDKGINAIISFIDEWHSSFSPFNETLLHSAAEGDKILCCFRFEGMMIHPFHNLPFKKRLISFNGLDIFTLHSEKIVAWEYFEDLSPFYI